MGKIETLAIIALLGLVGYIAYKNCYISTLINEFAPQKPQQQDSLFVSYTLG